MNKFIKTVGNIFKYKETKDTEDTEGGFELLEDKYENYETEQVPPEEYGGENQQNKQQETGNNTGLKQPMNVELWNRAKNEDKEKIMCLTQNQCLVSKNLQLNIQFLKQSFSMPKNQDIIIREFKIARKTKAFIIFVDGMVDKTIINQFILPQLMKPEHFTDFSGECPLNYIMENVISVTQVTKIANLNKLLTQVLNGLCALFIDGCAEALLIESRGFEKRNIDRPITEQAVMGSQEGFTENLRTNLTLLRRIIKNEKLITEVFPVGKANKVNSAILYIQGITNPKLVKEVRRRIKNINVDFIEGNGMLEQLIEDKPFILFPQVVSTERPDRAASFIVEGQVVIITEGFPFAMAVPISFFRLFHTSEDASLRWQYGTFIRLIRQPFPYTGTWAWKDSNPWINKKFSIWGNYYRCSNCRLITGDKAC